MSRQTDKNQKFLGLMDAADEVFNNEDIHDLKTFYQKLNDMCVRQGIEGKYFGASWSNHVKDVKDKFEQNGNRFFNENHQRFAQLHQKIDVEYCTAPENVTYRTRTVEPSTQTYGRKRTRTSAPIVFQSQPANESGPLRSILKKTSSALPNNHRVNHYATVPTLPVYNSYQPSAKRLPPVVLPQSPMQSPSVSISNGKNDISLQQNEGVVLKASNDDLKNSSTDPATVNPADKLNSSDITPSTPLASDVSLAKKCRFESPPSATPSLTVQQSEFYAHLTDTKFYDVILVASDGTKIPAHRNVLSFYSLDYNEIFEKSTELPVRLEMNHFDVGTIQAALDFMRFKPDSIVGKELALFKFAAKYNIPELMESCTTNADKLEITNSNVVEYVHLAYDYNLKELKEKCLKVFAENKKELDVVLWKGLPNNVFVDLINILHY
uniref:BTB domain-containing protein n=1 Tax=Panagrolaimus davidi TaxID=227884 RepID=A0A914PMX1_9BILA